MRKKWCILAQEGEELLILDQHGAHERILYERLLKNPAGRAMELPAPLFVQFAEDLALEVWAYEEELKAIGFDMEPFGEGAVRVLAAPETTGEPEIALIAAVEALAGGEGLAKALACKGSKKFGESLSREEMAGLLKDWASCEFRETYTSDGKPPYAYLASSTY